MRERRGSTLALAIGLAATGSIVGSAPAGAEQTLRIEEVVVYGKRKEATVSDTSLSITAMSQDFVGNMGIQGPDELINFLPATTRSDYSIKIRGVGRNTAGLGSDPGVGTYYNGIYSPDYSIAATEGGLYDVARIEVLRGPQGTLYGRNSVGGVINYVTNQPNHEAFEGNIRLVGGSHHRREIYGVVSGPLNDALAYRLTGSKLKMDGWMDGLGPAPDLEDTNDQNVALILDWNVTDKLSANLRFNDRRGLRSGNSGNGGQGILSEGPCIGRNGEVPEGLGGCDPRYRVSRDTSYYAPGLRLVDQYWADAHGAFPYMHPVTGETRYAAYNREGVDPTVWPFAPSPNYRDPWVARYSGGSTTTSKPEFQSLTNGFVGEEFDHQSTSLVIDYDMSDSLAFKYLGNYQWLEYWMDNDYDASPSLLSSNGDTVIETVWSFSHELRAFWQVGGRWTATSGLYYFKENRDQNYAIRNRLAGGRYNNPALYGPESPESGETPWVLRALPWLPPCFDWRQVELGAAGTIGQYCGDSGRPHSHRNDTGAMYEQVNEVTNENLAFYTQGDLQLTDTVSLTLGFRWSRDKRDILEQRGAYFEIPLTSPDWDWLPLGLAATAPPGFDASQFFAPGVTPLAALNVAMGAATFTGDPDFPIAAVCDLETPGDCARPLRLGGVPIQFGGRARGDYDDDHWSYRVNVNWEPTPDRLIYFGVTTGYRAGGFNAGGTDNRVEVNGQTLLLSFEAEEITAWEVGYKGTHLDGRLQVSGAIYYYDFDDYQDQVLTWESSSGGFDLPADVPAPPGRGPVDAVANIPKVENIGAEVDLTWLATEHLTLGGNYSYTESEWKAPFTIFNQDDPRYPRAVMGGDVTSDPCTETEPAIRDLYCLQIEGRQLSGIPKHKGTIWAAYDVPTSLGTLTFYVSTAFTGSYYTTTMQRPWDKVPKRRRTDLRVTFREKTGRWQADLFVDNVFDDTYLRWADMNPLPSGFGSNFPHRGVALRPRMWGAELSYNFGAMAR